MRPNPSTGRRPRRALIALAAAAALALAGCSGTSNGTPTGDDPTTPDATPTVEEVSYPLTLTDMNGRTVELQAAATKAFGAGPPGTLTIFTFDAAKLAGWNNPVSGPMAAYLDAEAAALPVLGRAAGGDGTFNPEVLLDAGVDLIIDAGDLSPDYRQMADDLQAQTGIPVIQLATDAATMDEAYEILGKAFGEPERAAELAAYVTRVHDEVVGVAAAIPEADRATVYYGQGDEGLATAGSGSIHTRVIDTIGAVNVAGPAPKPSGRGRRADPHLGPGLADAHARHRHGR